MKDFFNKIGLFYVHDEMNPYSYNQEDYKLENDKKSEAHKIYLKSIESEESSRLVLIESKTSQLISQTGIIFSLLSLFVPLLVDKVADLYFPIKFLLLILLISAFCFYLLTIQNALKNFNVKNFKYSKLSPLNVLNLQNKGLNTFLEEEVRDLLYCINENTKTNNKKATNLIHSYNSFKLANIFTGVLVLVFSIVLLFFSSKKEGLMIEKPIKIENFDSSIYKLTKAIIETKAIIQTKDTVYLKAKN